MFSVPTDSSNFDPGLFMCSLKASQDMTKVLQSKIETTQHLLDFLKDQRSIAESNTADTTKILCQYHILNSDCLTKIFQQDVALDSPGLQSCIDIDFGSLCKAQDFHSKRLFRLGLFLERSCSWWDISALLPTSSRWTDAFFSLPSKSFRSLYGSFFVSLIGPTELGLDTFAMAHSIRTFTSDISQSFLVFSQFPGASVKSYSAFDGSFREQVSALTHLPNVQDLVLLCKKYNMDIRSPVTPGHVQSLNVDEFFHDMPGSVVAQILENLVLPSLRKLRMSLLTEASSFPIQHHLVHIMTLELTCRLNHDEDVVAFCIFPASLTQLETLSVHALRIPDILMQRLGSSTGSDSDQIFRYVPWLRCLDLRRSTFADERSGYEALLFMVASRRCLIDDAEVLRETCLDRPQNPELSGMWEPLRKQGLYVNYWKT
ncbi:uncharacterized protein BT62DRAFT_936144 [Guyanagaster necrorhizus]|uniref:F-box domain-containing protein n=1 Tax=Guyanagaster necrorhizus TaxID=856835 RepID=A0A9P7VL15_9AGAR|nr:uncharacterized protein BT62DRAFT_936144 [Guyanagaster necrorhizus MCA 3950]KAG7442305.1 hypothetical protein BT62DRAFT_936144 [Guyanagaster necrorhizus MCA 3950]